MAESPVIPLSLAQNYPRPQQPLQPATGSRGPELDKWKSRVPKTGISPLVPRPLFSSAKCIVDAESSTATGEMPASLVPSGLAPMMSVSPPSTANPTPISPSPSLFPLPPSADAMIANPVSPVTTLHPSNSVVSRSSVYSQSTNGGDMAAATARPRPVSSIYSQNTLTTMTVTAPSSPRTPTMTNWASTLPGLRDGMEALRSEPEVDENAQPRPFVPTHMERVLEEPPVPQPLQGQIQVPRLRSPSLPQDRGNRRRTISATGYISTHGRNSGSFSNRPLVQSPERVSYPEMGMAPMDYEGRDWPVQKPSGIHSMPQKQYVSRIQGSNSYHAANKDSVSSTYSQGPAQQERLQADMASPRASLADSHTPICGPGEQRSGWWPDDDDVEQGQGANTGYAAVGMKEKPTAEAQRQRALKIKIITGVLILLILIIVGVAVGVSLGRQ